MTRNLFTPRKIDPSTYPTTLHACYNIDHLIRALNLQAEVRELYGRVKLSGALDEEELRDPTLAQALVFMTVERLCLHAGNRKKVKALINHLEKFV